ncbi:MAG: Hint domain-containing protein [Paracoccus sp. (in: a-proteobacteria)]
MSASNTYTVYYLGTFADLDIVEGDPEAEVATPPAMPTPTVFGSEDDPISDHARTMAPVGDPGPYYRTNNLRYHDQFTIDSGPAQTFDSVVQFYATLIYSDGTAPATITAVILQDTEGRRYLAPELMLNSNQQALMAAPIQSLELTSVQNSSNFGMDVMRFVCFAAGTFITTPAGPVAVECLKAGDMILTLDHGSQPLRWIGSRVVPAIDKQTPVRISRGVCGNSRDLIVSQQHRILMDGRTTPCEQGYDSYFLPAKKLIDDVQVKLDDCEMVEYFHLLLDRHEVIFAEGCRTESFYLGKEGWKMLPEQSRSEILGIFPTLEFAEDGSSSYGPLARPVGKPQKKKKNNQRNGQRKGPGHARQQSQRHKAMSAQPSPAQQGWG